MSRDGQTLVRDYVDVALAYMAAHDLMKEPAVLVDAAMLDPARPVTAGWGGNWAPWMPLVSTVTEADIHELEAAIGRPFPTLYVIFLRYRHFYALDDAAGVSFIRHGVEDWKASLWDHYFFLQEPGTLRQQGYIQFAYDPELKPICFDLNHRTPDGQDCAIVRVLSKYQDPAPTQRLYSSFFDLLLAMRAAQARRDTHPG